MVSLHVDPECRSCQSAKEALDDLALAHETYEHLGDAPRAGVPSHSIDDDGVVFRGHKAMMDHIEELRKFLGRWTSFQSDVCYCLDEEE